MPIIHRPNRMKVGAKQRERKPSGTPEEIARYNSRNWRKLRKQVLLEEPLCRECQKRGRIVVASVVDHITRARVDSSLFNERSNLQPLCKACHDKKSAKERHEPIK